MSHVAHLRRLLLLLCAAPCVALAQDNSFALTIQNGAMWQSNLTKSMINLGGTPTTGGGSSPASCMPPYDLQRGVNGQVPPQLQGDPRYQEYLRCKQGVTGPQVAPGTGVPGAMAPSSPGVAHLPIAATDFVPVNPGHPTVDKAIADMAITPEQRQQLRAGVEEMFRRVGTQYRANNLAVAVAVAYATSMTTLHGSEMNQQQSWEFIYGINDQMAQNPQFARMSAQQKQDEADKLIFQSAIISGLRDEGAHDPQAKQGAAQLSQVVLRQFGVGEAAPGSPPGNKMVLGVKLGPVSPAVAAAAGFQAGGGAFVIDVTAGSAADKAGIKAGDILVHVGDRDIKSGHDVQDAMAQASPGQVIPVRVFRHGTQSELSVAL